MWPIIKIYMQMTLEYTVSKFFRMNKTKPYIDILASWPRLINLGMKNMNLVDVDQVP